MSFHVEFKMNVPNALSILRFLLLPVFAVLYLMSDQRPELVYWAFGVLVLSGITDSLDGIIARHFNQVTDIGKILDPVADKVTQVVVVLCLAILNPDLIFLLVICFVKEVAQAIGGLILLRRGEKIQGAKWYGKVSTFTFYGVMCLIVLWRDMPTWVFWTLVSIVAVLMLFAFFNYMRVYLHLHKALPRIDAESADDSKEETAKRA